MFITKYSLFKMGLYNIILIYKHIYIYIYIYVGVIYYLYNNTLQYNTWNKCMCVI